MGHIPSKLWSGVSENVKGTFIQTGAFFQQNMMLHQLDPSFPESALTQINVLFYFHNLHYYHTHKLQK